MAYWLFKQEPDCYSLAQLEKDRTTLWDGVTNNAARKNLRQVEKGDRIFFYHTGKEKAVVGEMEAVSGPLADPSSEDDKSVVVRVKFVRRLATPVSLEQMKKESSLQGWDLLRLPRLSVMPVTEAQWQRVEELGGET